jgi:SAM-dependent methyltransferase
MTEHQPMMNTTIELGPYLQRSPDLKEDEPNRIGPEQKVAKEAILKLLEPYCPLPAEGMDLLDIGSGGGWCMTLWKCLFPATRIQCLTLFDAEADALRALRLQVHVGLQEVMPTVWRNKFHAVRASHVLEHSPAPCIAMQEYARVIKPGGVLQIVMPEANGYVGLGGQRPKRIGSFPGHPFCASSDTVIEMIRHVHLQFESYHEIPQKCEERIHYYHRIWMATKPC